MSSDRSVRVTVLGSGTLLPHPGRGSPAYLLEADGELLLLDCGSGALHGLARAGARWNAISLILLSHYHMDHLGDLPPLLWALVHGSGRSPERPLTIMGPDGLGERWENLARGYGDWMREPGFPLELIEVPPRGESERRFGGLRLRSHPVRHVEDAVAWRVEAAGGAVGYTGDTGFLPELGTFLQNVDILVAECGHAGAGEATMHLSPASLARLAKAARPGLLLVGHRPPELDGSRMLDLLREEGYTGRAAAPDDGFRTAT